MSNKISISLIITTYNISAFLDLLLTSVENQTFNSFEVIVADDGSDEKTKEVIKKHNKINITHVWHKDKGYRKALILNKAIKKAKGDYLVFVDGDCLLHKDFLKMHYKYQESGRFLSGRRVNLGPIFTETVSEDMIKDGDFDRINLKILLSSLKKDTKYFHRSLKIENKFVRLISGFENVYDIMGSNFSVYKEDVITVNGFNEDLENYWGEDGDLFLRLRNINLKIKSVKNIAIQFHLFHPRREPDEDKMKWYYEALEKDDQYKICNNGLRKIKK